MTIADNTFTRFDAIGVREQLSNVIANISPTDTPFMSNAKVGKARNTYFEWQKDSLATAVSTNQQLEGDVIATHTAVVPTVRTGNYVEIARKDFVLSETVQAVESAGGANSKGYIAAKLGKEIKRDMETSLLANKGAVAGNSGAARKSAGLQAFIRTNYSKDAGGTIPDAYTTAPTDTWDNGTQRAFTETQVKDVLQQIYASGGNTSTIMVGPFNKQVFSSFDGIVELQSNVGKGQAVITGAADTYVSDFGRLSVVPNRFQPARVAYFVDWSVCSVNYLRPYKMTELAKTGDAQRFLMTVEYGLQVTTDAALGVVADLTTS